MKTKPLEVKVLSILLLGGRNVPENPMLGSGRRTRLLFRDFSFRTKLSFRFGGLMFVYTSISEKTKSIACSKTKSDEVALM